MLLLTHLHQTLHTLPRKTYNGRKAEGEGTDTNTQVGGGGDSHTRWASIRMAQPKNQNSNTTIENTTIASRIKTHQHEDLDEDSAGRGRRVLAQADGLKARPGERVRVQEVGEELGHVPELVGLQASMRMKK